jgi:hypothetical protein
MTPAHKSREHRWRMLVLVVVVVAGVGVAAGARGTPAPVSPLVVPASLVSPPDAESSAWYCTGQTTSPGAAPGFLLLTNTTGRAVAATVREETDAGSVENAAVSVPARGDLVPSVPAPSSGSWLSAIVTVAGGGVAVSQVVAAPSGWSVSPCQSTTSAAWFFAGGSTAGSNGLYVSLLNPTSTPVVVDLSFVTPAGVLHPINDQGIVLQPDQVVAENVGSVVQDVGTVSTMATARTGRIVASEVQVYAAPTSGLSLVAGSNAPQSTWFIPQSEETAGGTSAIDVFNPGQVAESVTVHLRLPSGPLAPLRHTVAPGTTWSLLTSKQTRIPAGAFYSARIVASGGPGVVVGRAVAAPATAQSPQAGLASAVDGHSTSSSSGAWIVPAPGNSVQVPVANVTAESMAFMNTSSATERFSASVVTATADTVLVTGALAPGATAQVSGSALAPVGLNPVLVRSTGTMAVSDDVGPTGMVGVVTMPGIPLSAAIGGL